MPNSVVHEFNSPFPHSTEELWRIISDTKRLNDLVENPKYEVLRDDGVVDVFGRLRLPGFVIEWLEMSVNWTENCWFEQVHRFSNGPVFELMARFEIAEETDGCRCTVKLVAHAKNVLGRFLGKQATAKFEKGTLKVLDAAHRGLSARRTTHDARHTMIIEDRGWRRNVLAAQRDTTLQAFRGLFSEQVLRAGHEITISTITFMFADLAGSPSIFAQLGDTRAYPIVREHDGTSVKTIGDGLHAAFNAPGDAFRAALANWRQQDAGVDVGARIGVHADSSNSVHLNEWLDYYGNTLNMAARLEGRTRPARSPCPKRSSTTSRSSHCLANSTFGAPVQRSRTSTSQ